MLDQKNLFNEPDFMEMSQILQLLYQSQRGLTLQQLRDKIKCKGVDLKSQMEKLENYGVVNVGRHIGEDAYVLTENGREFAISMMLGFSYTEGMM